MQPCSHVSAALQGHAAAVRHVISMKYKAIMAAPRVAQFAYMLAHMFLFTLLLHFGIQASLTLCLQLEP